MTRLPIALQAVLVLSLAGCLDVPLEIGSIVPVNPFDGGGAAGDLARPLSLCAPAPILCPSTVVHTVATSQSAASAVAVDDSCVYWIAASGVAPGVYRAGRDGAGPELLAPVKPLVHPSWDLLVHDQDVYFTEPGTPEVVYGKSPLPGVPGSIARVARGGGKRELVAAGNNVHAGQPTRMAVDGGSLFWTENNGELGVIHTPGYVGRLTLPAGPVDYIGPRPTPGGEVSEYPFGIAPSGSTVYWGSDNDCNLHVGTVGSTKYDLYCLFDKTASIGPVTHVALDADWLYVATGHGRGLIARTSRRIQGQFQVLADTATIGDEGVLDMVRDGQTLYLATGSRTPGKSGHLARVPITGGRLEILAEEPATRVAVDRSYVYFTTDTAVKLRCK